MVYPELSEPEAEETGQIDRQSEQPESNQEPMPAPGDHKPDNVRPDSNDGSGHARSRTYEGQSKDDRPDSLRGEISIDP